MNQPDFVQETHPPTRIKVIGVGGGGSNAVDSMIDLGLKGVQFSNINTDLQALNLSKCENRVHLGHEVTGGMGCGGDPEVGEKAAAASKDEIETLLKDCEMVFIAAGLGGGTGTGAAPVVAEIAKSLGLLTVAIVTKPFAFEGPQRMKRAEMGLAKLSQFVDTKIVILNDKLMDIVGPKTPLTEAFSVANEVLARAVQAISDLISVPGAINVDFADVRTVMGETGGAVMGVGVGKGENRSTEAVKKACSSPLLEKIEIDGASGVLISITSSPDVSLQEINAATQAVYEMADPDANIIFGMVIDASLKDEMRVTIIATGFPDEEVRKPYAKPGAPVPTPAPAAAPAAAPQPALVREEPPLASPRTEMDLQTKLKSMMARSEAPRDEEREPTAPERDLHIEAPAPRAPQPNPRPAPEPREPEPQPREEEVEDAETPAYLKRRKRHLFE